MGRKFEKRLASGKRLPSLCQRLDGSSIIFSKKVDEVRGKTNSETAQVEPIRDGGYGDGNPRHYGSGPPKRTVLTAAGERRQEGRALTSERGGKGRECGRWRG